MKYEDFVGKVLDDRYKIESIVGHGGMAVVFRAEDIIMNRVVAIKVLKSDSNDPEKAIQRFINESKAVAMLSHPNIVNIYDVNVKDEIKYIVMEYVEGTTLKDYLSSVTKINWKEALHYAEQILRGLAQAHERGVVHRDVKPQNILLLKDGTIKVTDFGIAKVHTNDTITDGESAIGTVHYISPEQAEGKDVTPVSDIYSVGVMLYEMVTGKLPFEAESLVSVALMHITDEAISPKDIVPTIPEGLQFIILQAMSKKAEERFDNCEEMIQYIQELLKNPDVIFAPLNSASEKYSESNKKLASLNFKKQNTNDEQQRKKAPKIKTKKKQNAMMPIILGVFFAFLVVCLFAGVNVFKTLWSVTLGKNSETEISESDLIIVENLVGKEYTEELSQELYNKGYRIVTKEVFSDKHQKGFITDQNPEQGERRRNGFTIVLSISQGEKKIVLDDYTMTDSREALRLLRSAGLAVKLEQQFDNFIAEGVVIKMSHKPGDELFPGDTVTLYVSKGPEIKEEIVPTLTGIPLDAAKKTIEDYGFVVGKITNVITDDKSLDGQVKSQSLKAYTSQPLESEIDLEVYEYKKPEVITPPPSTENNDDVTDNENNTSNDTSSESGETTNDESEN